MPLSPDLDRDAVNLIRGFAMDAPLAANSGHQGTAMALAPLAHVLYSRVMKFDPADPNWPDRDRFVLSAGHASILQYSALYLSGIGLELDDIRAFRQWESATPGHPEAGHTVGVEVTTGPLGQGFANAVGMALAERILSEKFGTDAVDHHTYVIAGDGCLMEGVSHEAASLAGHLQLGKLICVYDDNHITIDGETEIAFSDDTPARFRAYGWDVVELGEIANDLDALEAALLAAQQTDRPSLLVLRSHIGYPSPDHADDHEAHGLAFDAADVTRTKEVMGIPTSRSGPRTNSSPPTAVTRPSAARPPARRGRPARRHDRHTRMGRLLEPDRRRRLGRRPADLRTRRQRRDPQRRSTPRSTRPSTRSPGSSPAPPTSPATPAPS
ncbi:MAG: hypothetical protein R2705_25055 [Ilumatobacteraceae bacterium]